jgi:hypothetical protein
MTTLLFLRRVTDVMTGHKAFSRRALRDLTLDEDGFAAEIGMATGVLANKKLRFQEVPICYEYRLKGSSKIRPSDGLACLLRLMKLRIRAPKMELKEGAFAEASRATKYPSAIPAEESRGEE